MCREAIPAVIELEHWGVPFSRIEDGRIYQRPFGGHTVQYGKAMAKRAAAAADRTGHAIIHTLYQQCLKNNAEFFVEYFALDLIMDEDRACRGVMAWNLEDGTHPPLPRAHGGAGDGRLWPRLFLLHLGAHLHRRRQRDGAARRACRSRTWNSSSSIRPASTAPAASSPKARAARAAIVTNSEGERFMERYAPSRQGPGVARRGEPRHDHRDPRGPRLRPGQGPHPAPSRASRSEDAARAAAGHLRDREDLRRRRRDARADPGAADRALQHGRHSDQLSRRGARSDRRRSRAHLPRPDGDRRGGLRLGPWRQPPRLQLAARHRRVRPRRGAADGRDRSSPARRTSRSAASAGEAAVARLDRVAQRQGQAQVRRDPPRHAAHDAERMRRLPHPGDARRGRAQDRRRRRLDGRSRHRRPLDDLEQRPGRGAGARQSRRAVGGGAPFGGQPHRKAAAPTRARISPTATTRTG